MIGLINNNVQANFATAFQDLSQNGPIVMEKGKKKKKKKTTVLKIPNQLIRPAVCGVQQ
jgi:hypothetical protein